MASSPSSPEPPRSTASGDLDCGNPSGTSSGYVTGGDWHPRHDDPASLRGRPSPELTEAAREHILELADTCSLLSDHMQLVAGAHRGRLRQAIAMSPAVSLAMSPADVLRQDPAFAVLVEDFAAALTLLTAAVDACEHAEPPQAWKHLIADSRVLRALEAGLEAERRLLLARALKKFLAEHPVIPAV